MDKFEAMAHDLLRGKEENPTPSQMFSIVSRVSEVARVVMSVNQNSNKRVCVIFEGQQHKTLKLFKKHFSAHAQKSCAYVYQLPIATQGRPLFHEVDYTAVREDLISNISQLYYLNENAYGALKSEMDKYSAFYNSRYDAYLLNYMRSRYRVDTLLELKKNGNFSARVIAQQRKMLSEWFLSLINESIAQMRRATGLSTDRITDKQIVIMLSRLAQHIVWSKNREFNKLNNSMGPRVFYYTDGDTTSDRYKRNGPKEEEFHLRNIFQFGADGPLLNKGDRILILKNLSLLEYLGNDSSTILEFRFYSGIILTFFSMIRDPMEATKFSLVNKGINYGNYIVDELYFYYIALVLAVREVDEKVSIENIFIEKLEASTLLALGANEVKYIALVLAVVSGVEKVDEKKPIEDPFIEEPETSTLATADANVIEYATDEDYNLISMFNIINIASMLDQITLTNLLEFNLSIRSEYDNLVCVAIEVIKSRKIFKEYLSAFSRCPANELDQHHHGQDIITEVKVIRGSICILYRDEYVCKINLPRTIFFRNQNIDYTWARDVILEIVKMSKKISIDDDYGNITLYIENDIIDYAKLCGREIFLKRFDSEIEKLFIFYSHEQVWSTYWWPISLLLRLPEERILSLGVISNTFIQDRATKHEVRLSPNQVLLGLSVNNADHASLYMQWLDERGIVCFEKFEIAVDLKTDPEGYCHLSHRKEYSESTSDQHLKEALGRFVKDTVQTQSGYAGFECVQKRHVFTYQEYLDSIRWITIISLSERIEMIKYINAMFYTESPRKGNELLCPFSVFGKNSVATIGRAKSKDKQSKNFYGEEIAPINCFDFCRDAVFATGNVEARDSFPDNLWFVKKIVNYPGAVKKETEGV